MTATSNMYGAPFFKKKKNEIFVQAEDKGTPFRALWVSVGSKELKKKI